MKSLKNYSFRQDNDNWEFAIKVIKYLPLLKQSDYKWKSALKAHIIYLSSGGVTIDENLY